MSACSITTINGFEVEAINKRTLKVTHIGLGISVLFTAPFRTFQNIHSKAVRCVDISSGGALGISCGDDGQLNIWDTSNGQIRRRLQGHVSDVSHCRFFPSGIVALSGGVDMRLKIWSAENGSCPRTMVGHTKAITDSTIIDKGRNIISCSRDGTARLWDCSRGECIDVLSNAGCVINGCTLGSISSDHADAHETSATNANGEIGTSSKLLILAREDGVLEGRDVSNKTKVFYCQCQSAVNCCEINDIDLIAGCQNGNIYNYDIRNARAPISMTKIGNSCINYIRRCSNFLAIAKGDGSVTLCDPSRKELEIITELTGPDADAIYRLAIHNGDVYTACRDAKIRRYSIERLGA
eukprot:gene33-624_t